MVEKDLRDRLYARLLAMAPGWFHTRTRGDLMALATNDIEAARMASGMGPGGPVRRAGHGHPPPWDS